MAKKKPGVTSTESTPLLKDALAATSAAVQIICDLESILHLISQATEGEVARVANIGIRVANDERMEELDNGHLRLRLALKD